MQFNNLTYSEFDISDIFMPKIIYGDDKIDISQSTFSDFYNGINSGSCKVFLGGSAHRGEGTGLFAWDSTNPASFTSSSVGFRISKY